MKYFCIANDIATWSFPEKALAIIFFNVGVKINPAKMPSLFFFSSSWINFTFSEIHFHIALVHKYWGKSILIKCINKFYIGTSGGWQRYQSKNPTRRTSPN